MASSNALSNDSMLVTFETPFEPDESVGFITIDLIISLLAAKYLASSIPENACDSGTKNSFSLRNFSEQIFFFVKIFRLIHMDFLEDSFYLIHMLLLGAPGSDAYDTNSVNLQFLANINTASLSIVLTL